MKRLGTTALWSDWVYISPIK